MNELKIILDKPYGTRSPIEQCISDAVTLEDEHDGDYALMEQAAARLVYLEACTRAVEDLMTTEATDATIAMFFKRDAKKLLKLKVTK